MNFVYKVQNKFNHAKYDRRNDALCLQYIEIPSSNSIRFIVKYHVWPAGPRHELEWRIMHMIMDIIVIAIFVLTIFISMRKGFMFTVAFFTKGIVSVIIAYLLSSPLGKLIEGTELGKATEQRIYDHLSETWQESEVYQALPTIFRGDADTMSQGFIERTAEGINHIAWVVLSFIVIVIVIRVVLGALVHATKRSKEKDGFTGSIDWFLGLLLGIIMGLILVFLFLALLFPVASLVAPGHAEYIMGWFNGSVFAQSLYDNNLLLLILSEISI